jgi:uncharacterized protein YegL
MNQLTAEMRSEPHFLETVWISVIAFASSASTLCDLTDIATFTPPNLPISDGRDWGAALEHLMTEMDRQVRWQSGESKRDLTPTCFLVTNGVPTADAGSAIQTWQNFNQRKVDLVGVPLGGQSESQMLEQFCDMVVTRDAGTQEPFRGLWTWMSRYVEASITRSLPK